MIRRALALAFVTAFGLAVAVWNIASRSDPTPMPIGTCVSISADDWLEIVTCDGPHTHVFTTWLAGLHHLRGSHNPCPSQAEVPSFLGDGVACYTPAAASRQSHYQARAWITVLLLVMTALIAATMILREEFGAAGANRNS